MSNRHSSKPQYTLTQLTRYWLHAIAIWPQILRDYGERPQERPHCHQSSRNILFTNQGWCRHQCHWTTLYALRSSCLVDSSCQWSHQVDNRYKSRLHCGRSQRRRLHQWQPHVARESYENASAKQAKCWKPSILCRSIQPLANQSQRTKIEDHIDFSQYSKTFERKFKARFDAVNVRWYLAQHMMSAIWCLRDQRLTSSRYTVQVIPYSATCQIFAEIKSRILVDHSLTTKCSRLVDSNQQNLYQHQTRYPLWASEYSPHQHLGHDQSEIDSTMKKDWWLREREEPKLKSEVKVQPSTLHLFHLLPHQLRRRDRI